MSNMITKLEKKAKSIFIKDFNESNKKCKPAQMLITAELEDALLALPLPQCMDFDRFAHHLR